MLEQQGLRILLWRGFEDCAGDEVTGGDESGRDGAAKKGERIRGICRIDMTVGSVGANLYAACRISEGAL
jgi:hypothetical protein